MTRRGKITYTVAGLLMRAGAGLWLPSSPDTPPSDLATKFIASFEQPEWRLEGRSLIHTLSRHGTRDGRVRAKAGTYWATITASGPDDEGCWQEELPRNEFFTFSDLHHINLAIEARLRVLRLQPLEDVMQIVNHAQMPLIDSEAEPVPLLGRRKTQESLEAEPLPIKQRDWYGKVRGSSPVPECSNGVPMK